MRSGVVTVALEPAMRHGDWLRRYWFDLVALVFASIAVMRCWVAYFDLHDRRLWVPLAAAMLVDVARRIKAAHRTSQRPITFSSDRRQDMLVAIALAVGPWPIVPRFEFVSIDAVLAVSTGPAVALAAAGIAVAAIAMRAVGSENMIRSALRAPTAVRELSGVPARHVASLFVLPGQPFGRVEFSRPAAALAE